MIDTDVKDDLEPIKKPAKAWRNWWKTPRLCLDVASGKIVGGNGECLPACAMFPSKDAAESKAMEHIAFNQRHVAVGGRPKYIGAFPEGERPNG